MSRRIHFSFPCRVKPRMTGRSWWKHKPYFEWCDLVRKVFGPPIFEDLAGKYCHVKLHLVVGRPKVSSDCSNHLKAVEDALVGFAYPDDSSRYLCDSHASADWGLEGFDVILTPCDGKCNFDMRGKK